MASKKTYLHNIKEHLLSQTVLLKELMLRVSPGDVPSDEFFTRRGHLQQLGVLFLYGQILGVAQQLPYYCSEVMGDTFANQILKTHINQWFHLITRDRNTTPWHNLIAWHQNVHLHLWIWRTLLCKAMYGSFKLYIFSECVTKQYDS